MPEPDVESPDDRITDHAFEPWTYTSGRTICIHWDQRRLRVCDRPEGEHAEVDTDAKALDDKVVRAQADEAVEAER